MRKTFIFIVICMIILSLSLVSNAARTGGRGRGRGMGMGGRGRGMGFGQQQRREPSEEEIKKIEEAMPTEAVVKPEKPRKLLVIDLVNGFFHISSPIFDLQKKRLSRRPYNRRSQAGIGFTITQNRLTWGSLPRHPIFCSYFSWPLPSGSYRY